MGRHIKSLWSYFICLLKITWFHCDEFTWTKENYVEVTYLNHVETMCMIKNHVNPTQKSCINGQQWTLPNPAEHYCVLRWGSLDLQQWLSRKAKLNPFFKKWNLRCIYMWNKSLPPYTPHCISPKKNYKRKGLPRRPTLLTF